MLPGCFSPVTSEAFTVAPEVVYSPIVPMPSSRQTDSSGHRDACRVAQPRDERGVDRRPRGGVFANRAAVQFATNRSPPDTAMPSGL